MRRHAGRGWVLSPVTRRWARTPPPSGRIPVKQALPPDGGQVLLKRLADESAARAGLLPGQLGPPWTSTPQASTIVSEMVTTVFDRDTTLDLLASRLKIRLLRYLATHPGMYTGRDLARALGSPPTRTAAALRELSAAGLLVRRRAAPAYLYSLNTHHYLVSDVLLPAFRAEQVWAESLGQEVRGLGGPDIASVILYGSAARRTEAPASDVDLAVIVRPGGNCAEVEEALRARHGALHERYGRAVSFLVIAQEEFRARAARRDPLVSSILADGRGVAGQPVADILAGPRGVLPRQGRPASAISTGTPGP